MSWTVRFQTTNPEIWLLPTIYALTPSQYSASMWKQIGHGSLLFWTLNFNFRRTKFSTEPFSHPLISNNNSVFIDNDITCGNLTRTARKTFRQARHSLLFLLPVPFLDSKQLPRTVRKCNENQSLPVRSFNYPNVSKDAFTIWFCFNISCCVSECRWHNPWDLKWRNAKILKRLRSGSELGKMELPTNKICPD